MQKTQSDVSYADVVKFWTTKKHLKNVLTFDVFINIIRYIGFEMNLYRMWWPELYDQVANENCYLCNLLYMIESDWRTYPIFYRRFGTWHWNDAWLCSDKCCKYLLWTKKQEELEDVVC